MDFPDNRPLPPTNQVKYYYPYFISRKCKCEQGHETGLMSHTGMSELGLDPMNFPIRFR